MSVRNKQATITSTLGSQLRRQSLVESDPNANIKEVLVKMDKTLNDKLDAMDLKIEQMDINIEKNAKITKELSYQIKDLAKKYKDMDKTVHDLKTRVNKQEKTIKKLSSNNMKTKEIQETMKVETQELRIFHEEVLDQIVMLEMHQREFILRLRGVLEVQEEEIEQELIQEIGKWLEVQEDELLMDIDKIFRIKSDNTKSYKGPGDCLIFLNSRLLKDKILLKTRQRKLIEDKSIKIFKELPKRILKKRQNYEPLTEVLNRNVIRFRWEFPEGLTFTFKDRKKSIRSVDDLSKFWEKHRN
ncbi:uncharacterized protein LOC144326308 [Podarcis muralis]